MPATVQRLIAIRAQIVEEALEYLNKVAERAARLPRYYPSIERGVGAFERIHQTVKVATDRREFDSWRAEEIERLRRSGIPVEHAAYSRRPGRDEDEPERRRQERAVRTVVWNDSTAESTEFRRCIILGDPGFGKSWLLRHEAWRLARMAADHLRERTIPLEEFVVPIHFRLSDLEGTRGSIRRAVSDLLCGPEGVSGEDAKQTVPFRELLNRKLGTVNSVLLLDGWDEITKDCRVDLEDRLMEFSSSKDNSDQRILLASRIVGYSTSPIDDAKEVVLQSFGPREVEAFAGVWFSDASKSSAFLGKLAASYSLGQLARIPLMLALMCRVGESEEKLPERRAELYALCLRGLLRDWKQAKPKGRKEAVGDVTLNKILKRMQRAAEKLLLDGMEQFSESAFAEAAGFDLDSQTDEAQQFVDNLKEDGILTPTNEEQTEFLFLHQTFQEYLAGCSLAALPWDELKPLIDRLSWSPGWRDAIVLMAGELGAAALARDGTAEQLTSVLALLMSEETDSIDGHRLALATLCLMEVPQKVRCSESGARNDQRIPETLVQQIIVEAHDIQWQALQKKALAALPHFNGCWPAVAKADLCRREVIPGLLRSLHKKEAWHGAVTHALVAMGAEAAKHPEVIPVLLRSLCDEENEYDYFDRGAFAEALGAMGADAATHPEVVPALLRSLREDREGFVRNSSAKALGALGAEAARHFEVIPALLHSLKGDENVQVPGSCARALGNMGSEATRYPELVPTLLHIACEDKAGWVREAAVEALRALGAEAALYTDVLPDLLRCLRDESQGWVRESASRALSAIGAEAVRQPGLIPALLSLCEDREMQCSLAQTLGSMGPEVAQHPDVIPWLLRCLRDGRHTWLFKCSALALGSMGVGASQHPDVIPTFLRYLREGWQDPTDGGIYDVTEALGAMGTQATQHPEVIPFLVRLLNEGKSGHDRAVSAWALGEMGLEAARHPDVIPDLLRCVRLEPDSYLRSSSARALGAMGADAARHPEVIPALLGSLHGSGEQHVLEAAAEALGAIERTGARMFLEPAKGFRKPKLLIRWVDDLVAAGSVRRRGFLTRLRVWVPEFIWPESRDESVMSFAQDLTNAASKIGTAFIAFVLLSVISAWVVSGNWSYRCSMGLVYGIVFSSPVFYAQVMRIAWPALYRRERRLAHVVGPLILVCLGGLVLLMARIICKPVDSMWFGAFGSSDTSLHLTTVGLALKATVMTAYFVCESLLGFGIWRISHSAGARRPTRYLLHALSRASALLLAPAILVTVTVWIVSIFSLVGIPIGIRYLQSQRGQIKLNDLERLVTSRFQ